MTQIGRSLRSDLKPGPLPLRDRRGGRIKRRANFTDHRRFVDAAVATSSVRQTPACAIPDTLNQVSIVMPAQGTPPHHAADFAGRPGLSRGTATMASRSRSGGASSAITWQKSLTAVRRPFGNLPLGWSDLAPSDDLLTRLGACGKVGYFLGMRQRRVGAPACGRPRLRVPLTRRREGVAHDGR
jgi:hypothetical protein